MLQEIKQLEMNQLRENKINLKYVNSALILK